MPAFAPVPYEPRPARFAGVEAHAGWRLKRYTITLPGVALNEPVHAQGRLAACAHLPQPAATPARAGLGFVIDHQAVDAAGGPVHYTVLCWWDRANELFTRTLVCGLETAGMWREGVGAPCVWDLRIVWHERNACIRHLLTPHPDAEGYLNDTGPIPE